MIFREDKKCVWPKGIPPAYEVRAPSDDFQIRAQIKSLCGGTLTSIPLADWVFRTPQKKLEIKSQAFKKHQPIMNQIL